MSVFTFSDLAFMGAVSGPQLWTPANITTGLWLDADDTSTVTLSSGAVSQWNDKSGNAHNFLQATNAQRPLYSAGAINGKNGIVFVDDFLRAAPFSLGSNVSFFFVTQQGSVTNINGLFDSAPSTPNVIRASGGFWEAFNRNPAVAVSYSVNSTNISVFVHGYGPRTLDYYANGSTIQTSSSTNFQPLAWTTPTVGAINSGVESFNGLLGEVIIFAQTIGLVDRQRIEGYLAHKWGLTANLPADHPYKTVAPTA